MVKDAAQSGLIVLKLRDHLSKNTGNCLEWTLDFVNNADAIILLLKKNMKNIRISHAVHGRNT